VIEEHNAKVIEKRVWEMSEICRKENKKEREDPLRKNHPTVVLVTAEAVPINTIVVKNV
jgi:hypothetical protein